MKKTLITFLTILPLLAFGQANKLYRKALRTTDLKEKIELLSQVISIEPKNLDAHFQRGIAKNDLGDYRGAIVDYSKIIVQDPDADTYYNRGNSRYSIKDYTGAKEDYAKAFMLDENFIDALYSLACVKFDLGEFENAITDFDQVIKMAPNQPKTYLLRASAYKALEKYTKALEDYTKAIIVDPNSNTFYNRGAFYMDINYFQKANDDLTTALKLNQNNSYAYFYRGASYLLLGKFTEAISDFSSALKFDSNDFDAYLGLAVAYYKINDDKNAKLNFDRANQILSINKEINSVDLYSNTYWFQNQYYYFNNNIAKLVKIK
ncbi:tetratricopeptide repeat protein [Tamlana sp. 2201CG12-4]|uniref:tetratricopeptide repeat protein n=1 Tax=Tamlana sp. 2201CG12-4 TaxID=3112582 RepID=UPI002DBB7B28|nr:tetratricopeptide repeat protein [Tamlana sp. 2201CG12-4]MEC3907130.1 tetratricopeptide repeat protein [Tamlana sp. 2201CG12-4]